MLVFHGRFVDRHLVAIGQEGCNAAFGTRCQEIAEAGLEKTVEFLEDFIADRGKE